MSSKKNDRFMNQKGNRFQFVYRPPNQNKSRYPTSSSARNKSISRNNSVHAKALNASSNRSSPTIPSFNVRYSPYLRQDEQGSRRRRSNGQPSQVTSSVFYPRNSHNPVNIPRLSFGESANNSFTSETDVDPPSAPLSPVSSRRLHRPKNRLSAKLFGIANKSINKSNRRNSVCQHAIEILLARNNVNIELEYMHISLSRSKSIESEPIEEDEEVDDGVDNEIDDGVDDEFEIARRADNSINRLSSDRVQKKDDFVRIPRFKAESKEIYYGGPEHKLWREKYYGSSDFPPFLGRNVPIRGVFLSQLNQFRKAAV